MDKISRYPDSYEQPEQAFSSLNAESWLHQPRIQDQINQIRGVVRVWLKFLTKQI